jgi:photosystem II stability/assembly factor-like uncharacterized protein
MPDVLKTRSTSVFVQSEPGMTPEFLGDCVNIDNIPNPAGVPGSIVCWNRNRDGFVTKGETIEPPGNLEYSISELVEESASYLEGLNCPFTLFALQKSTGPAGLFNNWVRGVIVQNNRISNDTFANLANRVDDAEMTHDYDLSGWVPRIDVRTITIGSVTVSTTQEALNFVSVCKVLSCEESIEPCDQFIAGADAPTGNGAAAEVHFSNNNGVLMEIATNDPHAVDEDLLAGVCFPWFAGGVATNRWLVAREPTTGSTDPYEMAYTDDEGDTAWNIVDVGVTLDEGATGPNSIFALDGSHIWVCTTAGNVYFSADGGVTWTDQGALGASGANALNCIHFCDEDTGYAVGVADRVIWTDNGGVTWTQATNTALGVALDSVVCFSRWRAIIGASIIVAGSLVMTFDGGATYAQRAFTGNTIEAVNAISFYNNLVGAIVTGPAAAAGSVHMTINGGATWFEMVVPANLGYNDIDMCGVNEFFGVGEVYVITSGDGTIIHGIG